MNTTTLTLTISHEGELPKGLLAALEAKAYDFTMAHGVACGEVVAETAQPPAALAQAWREGYVAGVNDERMSEANIGVAGFGAKVEPARENPYGQESPHRCSYPQCTGDQPDDGACCKRTSPQPLAPPVLRLPVKEMRDE